MSPVRLHQSGYTHTTDELCSLPLLTAIFAGVILKDTQPSASLPSWYDTLSISLSPPNANHTQGFEKPQGRPPKTYSLLVWSLTWPTVCSHIVPRLWLDYLCICLSICVCATENIYLCVCYREYILDR